jgi:hypothetical protein
LICSSETTKEYCHPYTACQKLPFGTSKRLEDYSGKNLSSDNPYSSGALSCDQFGAIKYLSDRCLPITIR